MSTSTQKPCTGDAGLPRNLPATSKRGGNSSVAKSPSEQALRPTACLSVFDGRTAVGHVVAWNGRGYEAYGADDVSFAAPTRVPRKHRSHGHHRGRPARAHLPFPQPAADDAPARLGRKKSEQCACLCV